MTTSSLQNTHYGTYAPEWREYIDKTPPGALEVYENMSIPDTRAMSQAFAAMNKNLFPGIIFEDHPIGIEGVTARVFRPGQEAESVEGQEGKRPLAVVTHAGGWCFGSHDVESTLISTLVQRLGYVVVSIDYRLAPEHPYPTPLNDSFAGFLWARENASKLGADAQNILLAGSSSGANLAAAIVQRAHSQGLSGIRGQLLNVPATCHYRHFPKNKYELESYESLEHVQMMSAKRLRLFWDTYDSGATQNPEVSPLLAKDLYGLPPAVVLVAGADVLRDEGIAYAKALENAGVKTYLKIYPGLPHTFSSSMMRFDEATEMFRGDIVGGLRNILGGEAV